MATQMTRRDALGTMLSASMAAILPMSRLKESDAQISSGSRRQPNFQSIRTYIQKALAQGGATGVAVAVAHGGRIVWEEGFGWANRELGLKVTPHTPFTLASITKTFTAATLVTLAAEGRVVLDEPANKYLTKSRITGTNGNAEAATVRLLGAHVSGLPGMFESYDQDEAKLTLSTDALIREYGRIAYPPNCCYEYSNIGFAALADIAKNVTGMDTGPLMTQRVLAPLGLRDSFFDTDVARLPSGAVRYDSSSQPIPYYTTSTPASGELYASAHDLARFAMSSMNNHVSGQKQILHPRWIDELHKDVFVGPSGISTTFGWFAGDLKSGVRFLFKGGGQAGVANILYMIPSQNLACLVLTNRSDTKKLAYSVCDQLAAKYVPDWQQPQEFSGYQPTPFVATRTLAGLWRGALLNGGANMPVRLTIGLEEASTLTLGANSPEIITELRMEGEAFTCVSNGSIDSSDAIRTGATTLNIKLIPHEGKLVGRVLAIRSGANVKTTVLPYVLNLSRASNGIHLNRRGA